jgi:hypothetical protein
MICALNLHAQINISGHHRGGGLRLIDEELSKYVFYLSWNIVQTGNKFTGTSTLMDNDSKKMTFKIMGGAIKILQLILGKLKSLVGI